MTVCVQRGTVCPLSAAPGVAAPAGAPFGRSPAPGVGAGTSAGLGWADWAGLSWAGLSWAGLSWAGLS